MDVVMEVVGSNQAICNAVAAAGPNSTIVLVGNPKADLTMEKNLYWKILENPLLYVVPGIPAIRTNRMTGRQHLTGSKAESLIS